MVVRSLVDRLRARFNASVAEVEALDSHRRAVVGAVVVGNQPSHCDEMLMKLKSLAENHKNALLQGVSTGVIPVGAGGELPAFEPEGFPLSPLDGDDDEPPW